MRRLRHQAHSTSRYHAFILCTYDSAKMDQGKAKHRAWKKVVDDKVTPADAEKKYVALVNELKGKYGST